MLILLDNSLFTFILHGKMHTMNVWREKQKYFITGRNSFINISWHWCHHKNEYIFLGASLFHLKSHFSLTASESHSTLSVSTFRVMPRSCKSLQGFCIDPPTGWSYPELLYFSVIFILVSLPIQVFLIYGQNKGW